MTSVLQLLSLPANSKGFTALSHSITEPESPRKTLSNSPSAARAINVKADQPIKIQLVGASDRNKLPRPINLQQCIKRILSPEIDKDLPTFEDIYNQCFSVVCVSNAGEGLYQSLRLEFEQAVTRLSLQLEKTQGPGDAWLKRFVEICQWFEKQVALLQSLLTYLDQVYVRNAQVSNIRQLALSLYVRSIFENPQLMNTLRRSVHILVKEERDVRMLATKTNDIPALVAQLCAHQQYSVFEEYYREMTLEYYEKESARLATEMKDDPKRFFSHVQSRIEEEVERSKLLLPIGSWSIMRDVTLKSLLHERMVWIAQETLGDYLDHKDFGKLTTMNDFFPAADGAKIICAVFKTHVQKTVQSIVKDTTADDMMVQRLLDLHALLNVAIKQCFLEEPVQITSATAIETGSTSTVPRKRPNQEFVYALSDAFAIGFKARRNKPAEMIARHLDKLMRKGQGSMSDAEFNALLNAALGLYRFTDDKDVFRGFYLRALSKRLLLEKSASNDFEATMLKKLKDEYDPAFSLGEEMFSDLALSREAMVEYHSKLPSDSEGRRLSVMVLKQGAWPYSKQDDTLPSLPPNMHAELLAFEKFYKDKHTGRELKWQPSVATVTMNARFKAGKKELSLSLYQSAVLLLFNDSDELSFTEIFAQVNLSDPILRLTLQSLACGKKKVLLKKPTGRDVEDGDVFRFNDGFVDPRAKVHINSIQAKVTAEESRQTQSAIDSERSSSLDAAIVRIMKAKKEMMHERLVNATVDAVKNHFIPDVKTIKMRIEKLMEQEYVRRDEDKPQMMIYVA
ncbi:Cullin family-domain-containing protein [Mycena belliarum]|uniref:Cullin family-domain-containing protein n=1 Tax=Mycena belliarum TaxID=1033014 RepID=A0AAD6UG76_9AGAR|nr:Cullin family-domain-containing protein [Mycena belliae]